MDLQKLTNDLNGPDEADRLYAAEDLGTVNDAAAVAVLANRLPGESSRAVQETIFRALGQIGGPAVLQAAMRLIGSDEAFIRNEAVHLLGTLGSEAIPLLAEALGGADCDQRKFVLDALATIESDLKGAIYRQVLGDADLNLVITAVEYIGRDNQTPLKADVEAVLERATHPMLVAACVEALGQIGDAGSLDLLYHKLGSDGMSEFLAPGYIRALGNLGTDAHVEQLCRLVERLPALLVDAGFDAIEAIRRRVTLPPAPPALREAVDLALAQCPDALGRYQAVRALGAFTDEGAREAIRKYLESPDKMVRLAAVESIGHWDAAAGKDLLLGRQMIETDDDVRDALQDAINQQMRNAA